MKSFKKILKFIGLFLIIVLASVGVGIAGAILPEQRDPMKKEDTIEMVDESEQEGRRQ